MNSSKKSPLNGLHVLVVDDDHRLTEELEEILKLYDTVPASVQSGKEALQYVDRYPVQLILMDIQLQGRLDGIETAQTLYERHRLPIIFITAHTDEDLLKRALEIRPFGYLLKPFKESELKLALEIAWHRHGAEKKLYARHENLSLIVRQIDVGIIVIDETANILYANPAAQQFLQISDMTSQKKFPYPLNLSRPMDVDIIRKCGKPGTGEMHAAEMEWEKNKAYLILIRDVTEAKLLEKELRHSQKMEAIGRLAGGVAHDFNNQLTIIMGFSDMLIRSLADNARLKSLAEEINKSAVMSANLTRQLLAFSRKQQMMPKVFNMNILIGDIQKMIQRLIHEDIEISVILQPGLPNVEMDPNHMEQALMNLVVNARDAMPEGGKIIIETQRVTLGKQDIPKFAAGTVGDHVMVSVSDTGTGMTEEVKSHIFEPFFTTKEKGKGTGLGLATIYGMIQQSGGFIDFYSEMGVGTVFKIYIPVTGQDRESKISAGESRTPTGHETILIVEDDEGVRKITSSMITNLGYRVYAAANVKEALALLDQSQLEKIDLVITDIVLPQYSGKDFSLLIRKVYPKVKLLYMSGYTDETVVNRGLIPENSDFIQKPFMAAALAQKIREILDRS